MYLLINDNLDVRVAPRSRNVKGVRGEFIMLSNPEAHTPAERAALGIFTPVEQNPPDAYQGVVSRNPDVNNLNLVTATCPVVNVLQDVTIDEARAIYKNKILTLAITAAQARLPVDIEAKKNAEDAFANIPATDIAAIRARPIPEF